MGLSLFMRLSSKIANSCHTEAAEPKQWGRISDGVLLWRVMTGDFSKFFGHQYLCSSNYRMNYIDCDF